MDENHHEIPLESHIVEYIEDAIVGIPNARTRFVYTTYAWRTHSVEKA